MKVIVLATHDSGYLKALKQSCNRYGYELIVLGWGEKWRGFTMRANLYKEYLEKLPQEEYVICCDAFDVIALRHSDDLLKKIEGYDKVLTGFDEASIITKYMYGKPPIKINSKEYFANAGFFIGKCRKIKNIFDIMCINEKCNNANVEDQGLLNRLLQVHTDIIDIDTESEIIYNLQYPKDYLKQLIKLTLKNESYILDNNHDNFNIKDQSLNNGNKPFFIHANGNSNINSLCKELGYHESNLNNNFNSYNGLKTIKIMTMRKLMFILHIIFVLATLPTPIIIYLFKLN